MKKKQYFPFEVNMINDKEVLELLEKCGPKGLGGYAILLVELRNNPGYRCSLNTVKGVARRYRMSNILLKQVLYDFHLFEITQEGGEMIVSSPYLNRAMSVYDEKLRKLSEAAKKRSDKYTRNDNGFFTNSIGTNKTKLNKTTTTVVGNGGGETPRPSFNAGGEAPHPGFDVDVVVTAGVEMKSWETYLDIAIRDEAWMEILAMNSGISRLFVKHQTAVIEAFRQHVCLQGNEAGIQSVKDAKSYFANFIRQGTPTQKRVTARLAELEEETRQTSAHPYETIDPQTGERSYFGNPIPPDAPPRPNDNAVWSEELGEWI